jgi:hypothetical protein
MVDLVWNTTEEISPYEVQDFHNPSFLLEVSGSDELYFGSCINRCVHLSGERQTGIRIHNVTSADAGKYMVWFNFEGLADSDAILFIFRKFNFFTVVEFTLNVRIYPVWKWVR